MNKKACYQTELKQMVQKLKDQIKSFRLDNLGNNEFMQSKFNLKLRGRKNPLIGQYIDNLPKIKPKQVQLHINNKFHIRSLSTQRNEKSLNKKQVKNQKNQIRDTFSPKNWSVDVTAQTDY